MPNLTLRDLPAGLLVLLFPPVLYVASYAVLLAPSDLIVEPEKGNFSFRQEDYRIGGEFSRLVFRPLHGIDYRIRPRYWHSLTEKGKGWFTNDELRRQGYD